MGTISAEAILPFSLILPFATVSTLKGIRGKFFPLTFLHSDQPKLYRVLAILKAKGIDIGHFGKFMFTGEVSEFDGDVASNVYPVRRTV